MEATEESAVHGQLVELHEADSDADAADSRASLVAFSSESESDVDAVCTDAVVELGDADADGKIVFRASLAEVADDAEASVFEADVTAAEDVRLERDDNRDLDDAECKVLNTAWYEGAGASAGECRVEVGAVDVCDVLLSDADGEGEGEGDPDIGHLLRLVRALAQDLPAPSIGGGGGVDNLAFEDADGDVDGGAAAAAGSESDGSSSTEDIDWSWLADEAELCAAATTRPPSWLRASMRRVRRFALGEPQSQPRVLSAPAGGVRVCAVAANAARASAPAPVRASASASGPPSVIVASAPPSDGLEAALASVQSTSVEASAASPARSVPDPDDFPRRYSMLGRIDARLDAEAALTPTPSAPPVDEDSASDCSESGDAKEDRWPHSLSSLLSALGCTLGLFNVCRFGVLSVHFGANFVLQFLLLSMLIGWPLYVLHGSLGQHLRAGAVDMWRISPLFQGVGVALLLAQTMLGLYSVVGVAWLFTYFRDSFINKYDAFRWAENGTRLEESVSEYLNEVVLQRQSATEGSPVGHLKFQVTFNLAVVWMIVFVCLSKGIKSYGKAVYLFGAVPVAGIAVLTAKTLSVTDVWFEHSAWRELFSNANCWTAAAIECFTTWGLMGAATMQMRSHAGCCRLAREVLAVGVITLATLVAAALLANGFAQILRSHDLRYVPTSFERTHESFLEPVGGARMSSTPPRWLGHSPLVVGVQVGVPGAWSGGAWSGYQVAPFATQLGPAVFARLGPQELSPFWAVLFYFSLILLGISQQLCTWHCVITGIMAVDFPRLRAWETTITFLSCACGFVLGLPLATEHGVWVVYFMDYCVGGAWWLALLQAVLVVAALLAIGGEAVAQTLLGPQRRRALAQAIVVFAWNVGLPVALVVTSVTWFKANGTRELYSSRAPGFWPAWARRVGCLLQLAPLVLVPLVAALQAWRYLSSGPPDLFDRMRLLCRPGAASVPSPTAAVGTSTSTPPSRPLPELVPLDDPPPKYTPPPSYATATGARIAKLLRRSFRRLVGTPPPVPSTAPAPPDYSAVLVEMGVGSVGPGRSALSAPEVAQILRSSLRRTARRGRPSSAPTVPAAKAPPVI